MTSGICECGCGQPTKISPRNQSQRGYVRGQPRRFVHGHGRSKPGFENKVELARRFDQFVDIRADDACWPWLGASDPCGYGQMCVNGRIERAHRLAWLLSNGEIEENLRVLHRCDNPPCVNPAHLFLGTQLENVRDCITKKRNNYGERCGSAKLSEPDVRAIRELVSSGHRQSDLAKRFGVSHQQISRVSLGRAWKHLDLVSR